MSYPCPRCQSTAQWKEEREHRTVTYKKCGECGYAPAVEAQQLPYAGEKDASAWVEETSAEVTKAAAKLDELEVKLAAAEKPDLKLTVQHRKANRILELALRKQKIALAIADIIQAGGIEGQVLIHTPELGMLTQFAWGDYDLLKPHS